MAENTHDAAPVQDGVHAEVKGPDESVWGADEDRPEGALASTGPGLDEVYNEGEEDEVKGPSSEVWAQDENGNYPNR